MELTQKTMEFGILGLGILLVVLGTLMARHWDSQIEGKYYEEMAVSSTSSSVQEWISPTVPIISNIYFWNWTNAEDISSTPHFEEVGPYVFREKHIKINMTWNDNATVTYRTLKYWYFDEEQSNGTLDDSINSINTFATTISAKTRDLSSLSKRILSMTLIMNQQKIFWTKTIRELTFGGFDIPILRYGSFLSANIPEKFGYFYGRNGTIPSDVYNMDTGSKNIYNLGNVKYWNYDNITKAHNGTCAEVKGSLGELWSPRLTNESVLQMFASDMCRRISYYYIGQSEYSGISTYVYGSTPESVDNGGRIAENSCYCQKATECPPSGIFDLSSCKEGAPIVMSFPHLYLADPIYRAQTTGMQPNAAKHTFLLEMEPRTGIPLNVAARLQLNVNLTANPYISMFQNAPNALIPVFWIETIAALPDSHLFGVKLLLTLLSIGPYISALVLVIGIILILFVIIKHYRYYCSNCGRKCDKVHVKIEMQNTEAQKPMISRL